MPNYQALNPYGFPDFAAFVGSIESVTRRLCVLIMRAPIPEDLLCIAARHIWGLPYDSPNFQVAYNALLQSGRFPSVLIENTGLWDPWTSASLEEALDMAERRLGLQPNSGYGSFLRDLLARHLVYKNGCLVWPQSMRTALIYWNVDSSGK